MPMTISEMLPLITIGAQVRQFSIFFSIFFYFGDHFQAPRPFFAVVLNIHRSQTIFTALTFWIKGQFSCSLCATHFSFSIFGFTLFMVHFVYKKLKGMGCGFTVAKSEWTKVLWPLLDYTHLTCTHSQLELVWRKSDLITHYFHSSHLLTRETCNFASWTIRIVMQDATLIPFTPNSSWFLEDVYMWDLLYTQVMNCAYSMHTHKCVYIYVDMHRHTCIICLSNKPSFCHSYEDSFFAIVLFSVVLINSQMPTVVLVFFKRVLATELKQTLNTT